MVLSPERKLVLRSFCHRLGVDFVDLSLLNQALLHSSFTNENNLPYHEGNERLEFLGDAVLGLIVTEELFKRYEERKEGELSKVKSVVVSRKVLAEKAQEIGLGRHLLLGKGEEITGGRTRKSILANTFESVVGAIYLSGGIHLARQFVMQYLEEEIERVISGLSWRDHKSELQERLQRESGKLPSYRVVDVIGPDHDKIYRVEVLMDGQVFGEGEGKSKKSAEQAAAREALEQL